MAKEDTFGPMLEHEWATTTEPLTIIEAAERVGCSKQRAYSWVDRNRQLLKGMGQKPGGGTGYVTRSNPHFQRAKLPVNNGAGNGGAGAGMVAGITATFVAGTLPDFQLGMRFELIDIATRAGAWVLTFHSQDTGQQLEVAIRESE